MNDENHWYQHWFNEDYLKLYAHRSYAEAEAQVDFLVEALHLSGKESALDLGCGNGRHALAFAKKGIHVTGVDRSPTLIQEARKLLEKHPNLSLQFVEAEIRNFHIPLLFDVAVNLFTSFGYYEKDEENEQILKTARRHLKEKGQFILDFLHPYEIKTDLKPYEEIGIEEERVVITKKIFHNRIIKTIAFPNRTYEEKVTLYSRQEIEQMLETNGFEILEVWNDYQGNPWQEKGNRQIFRCRAT